MYYASDMEQPELARRRRKLVEQKWSDTMVKLSEASGVSRSTLYCWLRGKPVIDEVHRALGAALNVPAGTAMDPPARGK